MKTTAEYLDAVKAKLELPSDYALAKYWGVSKQDISEYRAGKRTLGEDRAIAVAEILGIDPAEPLIASHAERAKSTQAKEVWTSLFERISEKISEGFESLLLGASPRRMRVPAR
jgi:predicted transcriptional regulator